MILLHLKLASVKVLWFNEHPDTGIMIVPAYRGVRTEQIILVFSLYVMYVGVKFKHKDEAQLRGRQAETTMCLVVGS